MILDTFDEVAARYAAIKPLRGKHKDQDVRPIGNRRQKWERIVKMDDSTYLLTDQHYGDPVFTYWHADESIPRVVTREEQINLAPIVWRKLPDGTETVTVRNASGRYGHQNGRYSFLISYLPTGLVFCKNRRGEHYVARATKYRRWTDESQYGNKHFLALSRTVPAFAMQDIALRNMKNPNQAKYTDWATAEDDGAALTFKRTGTAQWEFVGGGKPRTVTRNRIKKDAKQAYKPLIDQMFTFILTMRPLLQLGSTQRENLEQVVEAWKKENRAQWYSWRRLVVYADTARAALNPEHPLHLALAYDFMQDHMSSGMPNTVEKARTLRADYNKWINKYCGFTAKVTEERPDA